MTNSHRQFITSTAAVAASTILPTAQSRAANQQWQVAPEWLKLLGTSETGGRDYAPTVVGRVDPALRGALYRNGPGLFERGQHRVRHLLDGDGLIQRLSFTDAGVRYQNAFVKTEKFLEEEAAGTRLHATWTTRKPGGFLRNLGGGISRSQAGVTVYPVHGKLIARDETGPCFEIDPESLATRGTFSVVDGADGVGFKAHSKFDDRRNEWLIAGQAFGPTMHIHVATHGPGFKLKRTFQFKTPRQVYLHDFFITEKHLVFVLHPCTFSPFGFLAGTSSFTDSLTWEPDAGNVVAVVSREDGEPRWFDAPARFMWHALNAFERDGQLTADFVGYTEPDHFIGEDALFANLMQGRMGRAEAPGQLVRYQLDRKSGTLSEEIIDAGNHEFPAVAPREQFARHRYGYFAAGGIGGANAELKRFDYSNGKTVGFDFGDNVHIGEPVFAPKPGGKLGEGWLLAQGLDGKTSRSFYAILDANAIADGPEATIHLKHHLPISFHGAWVG